MVMETSSVFHTIFCSETNDDDDEDDDVLLQWGPYSEALRTLTGAGVPDTPSVPEIYFKSPTTAVLSWHEPVCNGAPVTEYHLEWTFREDQDFMPVSVSVI